MSLNITQARKVLKDAGTAVAASVATIGTLGESISRERVRIGIQYVLVSQAIAAQPTIFEGTWKTWADEKYPKGPDAYRLFHAGTVALIIGDVGDASERHLVPFYRIVKAAEIAAARLVKDGKKDEADAVEKAAEALILKTWNGLVSKMKPGDPMPSEEKILAAVDKATGTKGGTRGAKAGDKKETGSKSGTRSTRKARAKSADEKKEPVQTDLAPSLGEAELRSLGSKVRTAVSRIETEDLQGYSHTVHAICAWVRMYGTEAVLAAVKTEIRDARKSRKAAA